MKIALIFPPAWAVNFPPLGINCIAEVLRLSGEEVKVYDWNIELWQYLKAKHQDEWNRDNDLHWDSHYSSDNWKSDFWEERNFEQTILPIIYPFFEERIQKLLAEGYDAVGFSLYESTAGAARNLARMIRKENPNIKLFVGGPSVTDLIFSGNLHQWLDDVDAIVLGEGEHPVSRLAQAWKAGSRIAGIPGIAARDSSGKMILTAMGEPYSMDLLKGGNYDDYDLSSYLQPTLPISSGRGCVISCTFCSEGRTWKPFRVRTTQEMLDEIQHCVNRYGITSFNMVASVFNGDHRKVREFCEGILSANLKIVWVCNGRLSKQLTAELIELMARSGCVAIAFGLESGSNDVLTIMKKYTTSDIGTRIVEDCHHYNIKLSLNVIVGFPGETEADFQQTLNFCETYADRIHQINVTKCALSRGSDIHDHPAKFGIIADEKGALAAKLVDGQWTSYRHEWKHIVEWATTDFSNNPIVRDERHDRLLGMLDSWEKRGNTPFDSKLSIKRSTGESKTKDFDLNIPTEVVKQITQRDEVNPHVKIKVFQFYVEGYGLDTLISATTLPFSGNIDELKDFCRELLSSSGNKTPWVCSAQISSELTTQTIELMANAGCYSAFFGFDNNSSTLAARIVEDCNHHNIKLTLHMVVGSPNETEEDFQKTLRFCEIYADQIHQINVTKYTLLPDSDISNHPGKFGLISDEIGALAAIFKDGNWKTIRHKWKHLTEWATTDFLNNPILRNERYAQLLKLLDTITTGTCIPFSPKSSIGTSRTYARFGNGKTPKSNEG
jgi:tRNA A37 methylthiotransferase MiaB